jgi:hypothetical protein
LFDEDNFKFSLFIFSSFKPFGIFAPLAPHFEFVSKFAIPKLATKLTMHL